MQNAMAHAGPAVVFSGTTVAIALLALVVLPVPFLRSIGIAGMLIPLVSVAVALTLLPVVLATIGPRLDWPRGRRADARRARAGRRGRGSSCATAGPPPIASTAVLAGAGRRRVLDPARQPARRVARPVRAGARRLREARGGRASAPGRCRRSRRSCASGDPGAVAAARAPSTACATAVGVAGRTALVTVIPAADGNSAEGRATLDRIRDAAPARGRVGGQAAQSADFVDAVYGKFPLVVALDLRR